nr:hira [Cryptomonas curvata]
MKLNILKWIYHGKSIKKRLSIFSIDFQPFGMLILTTGEDSVVKMWLIKEIFKFKIKFKNFGKKKKKKHISQEPVLILENHKNIINIVRWSVDGKKFASGSDDGYLLVYENPKNPILKFFWRIYHKFQSHTGDIVDIAWCSNCELIATASLDNSVIIWSLENKSILIELTGHKGWVKGISWDPMGRFLASQSDDKNIIIWKTNFWKLFKKIKIKKKLKMTQHEIQTDFFSRSSWSSCGRYLFICNSSFNSKKSSIFVLDRLHKFQKKTYVTGFEFLARIIRCSFRIYKNIFDNILKSYYSFGTADGIFTIFSTDSFNSHIYLKYLMNNQIIDISWLADGYALTCCSFNGYIFYLKFSTEELGKILNFKEHSIFLKQYFLILNKFTLNGVYNFFIKRNSDDEKLKKFLKINSKLIKNLNFSKKRWEKKFKKILFNNQIVISNFIFLKFYLKNFYSICCEKIFLNGRESLIKVDLTNFFIIQIALKKIIFNIVLNNYYNLDSCLMPLQNGKNINFNYFLFFKNKKFFIKIIFIKLKKNQQILIFSKISFLFYYKIYIIIFDCFGNCITINLIKMKKIIFRKSSINLIYHCERYPFYEKLKIFLILYICSGLINSNFLIFA